MNRPHILVFGASGMLGSEVCANKPKDAILTIPSRNSYDFTDLESVQKAVHAYEPSIVINCAAMTNVDDCETDRNRCEKINAISPQIIACACEDLGARFVHISTDFAFDGKLSLPMMYHRDDVAKNPTCYYGESKLISEELVMEACPSALILRLSWLFGGNRLTFPDWVLAQAEKCRLSGEQLHLPSNRYGSPSYVPDIAKEVVKLAMEDRFGILHLVNGQEHPVNQSAYGVECLYDSWMLDAAHLKETTQEDIVQSGAWKVLRPVNSSLQSDVKLRDWREALRHYLQLKSSLCLVA